MKDLSIFHLIAYKLIFEQGYASLFLRREEKHWYHFLFFKLHCKIVDAVPEKVFIFSFL